MLFLRIYILFWPKISAKTTEILAQDTSKMHKNALRDTHKSKFSYGIANMTEAFFVEVVYHLNLQIKCRKDSTIFVYSINRLRF